MHARSLQRVIWSGKMNTSIRFSVASGNNEIFFYDEIFFNGKVSRPNLART